MCDLSTSKLSVYCLNILCIEKNNNESIFYLFKKVLYEFNYLSVCLFIYLFIYIIYVTCSRLEQKLSKISKILKRRMLCNLMLSVLSPKKFGVRRIPRLGTGRLKNEIGHVTHQSIENFV
jgi:hypothetical protein